MNTLGTGRNPLYVKGSTNSDALQFLTSPLLQPLLNTRLLPLLSWFIVAASLQTLR